MNEVGFIFIMISHICPSSFPTLVKVIVYIKYTLLGLRSFTFLEQHSNSGVK